jgi:hypothetical protein
VSAGEWTFLALAGGTHLFVLVAVVGGLLSYRRYGYACVIGAALALPLVTAGMAFDAEARIFWMVVSWGLGWLITVPMLAVCGLVDAVTSWARQRHAS